MAVTSVFISSTSSDLKDYRATVRESLLNAGYHPIDMADFMARSEGATSACLEEVAEGDLFVGIYAWRYGFVPQGAKVSITEQEYDEALRLEKPRFCFFVDEKHSWPEESRENGEGAEQLKKFKAKLDATLVRTTFTTPDDLAKKVLSTLARHEKEEHKKTFDEATRLLAGVTSLEQAQDLLAGVLNERQVEYEVDKSGIFILPQGSTTLEVEVFSDNEVGLLVDFRAVLAEDVDPNKIPPDVAADLLAQNWSAPMGAIAFDPASGMLWYSYRMPANILTEEIAFLCMSYVANLADSLDEQLADLLPTRPKRKGSKK